ncbi:uncharacterized protein LOC108735225 [Agrilus planipennis]|uniref:Uncharacterized protein LOC108735225 n=1 Tax=Agrilus planipennis TaxID=224129 RepID=A0A1W4WQ17_AGRPL|nr:uncharacterized protein LOC108735225 [Agrilus planipennis]
MNSLVLVVSSLIVTVFGQRPMYAGQRPIRYPDLASRFKGDNSTSTTAAVPLDNRFGANEPVEPLPVDAKGDADLVNRLNQWPEENRPYWLINAQQIEKHRGSGNVNNSTPLNSSQFPITNSQPLGRQPYPLQNQNQRGRLVHDRVFLPRGGPHNNNNNNNW